VISPADLFAHLDPPAVYAVLFGLVTLEGILVFGPFVPTLGSLMIAGFLAHAGILDLPIVVASAGMGAVVGDLIGYHTGRRLGPGLENSRLVRRAPVAWNRAKTLIHRRGGLAIVPCRFVPVVRTVVPHLVGAAGTPYRRLVFYSITAAAAWACAESGVGYLAGASYDEAIGGKAGLQPVVVIAGLIAGVLGVTVYRHRAVRGNHPHRTADSRRGAAADHGAETPEDLPAVPGLPLSRDQQTGGGLA
jgi:membrane-associated protein